MSSHSQTDPTGIQTTTTLLLSTPPFSFSIGGNRGVMEMLHSVLSFLLHQHNNRVSLGCVMFAEYSHIIGDERAWGKDELYE